MADVPRADRQTAELDACAPRARLFARSSDAHRAGATEFLSPFAPRVDGGDDAPTVESTNADADERRQLKRRRSEANEHALDAAVILA